MPQRRSIPVEQLSTDTIELYETLNNESDLACVTIGAAFLDAVLVSLLEQRLLKSKVTEKLLDSRGALGSFVTRADLAYCLSLVSKGHYQDLERIARIRNRFDHNHLKLTFTDQEIRKICDSLNEWRVMLHGENEKITAEETEEQRTIIARNQFNLTVVFLSNWLLVKTLHLKANAQQGPTEP